ncbi:MAG: chromate transporter [Synechococcaceae cyanobacterium]|nr:chromate transporter [Synechococcaceae cyanobacterium]
MPAPVSLAQASRFWLRLGWVSFGGPAAQIALLHHELVVQRRWLSERRFLHALQYCMLLPGPEATQLAAYLGFLMHGVFGSLVAGGLFLLPSVLVLLGLSSAYALWGQLPLLSAVFWSLRPMVLAIVLVACWRLGHRTLKRPLQPVLAALALLAVEVWRLPYPLILLLVAASGWLAGQWRPELILPPADHATPGSRSGANLENDSPEPNAPDVDAPASPRQPTAQEPASPDFIHGDHTPSPRHARFSARGLALTLLVWASALTLPLLLLSALNGWQGPLATMARFFTRVAFLSFGGAYAVLPYVAQGAVERFGWLTSSQMVDGLALGETTPGPLIMVVAFVGFMGGWQQGLASGAGAWPWGLAALLTSVWFTFLPSFGFILAGAPLVEASRGDLRLAAPLAAITAAVVGMIAALALFLAGPALWPGGRFDLVTVVLLAGGLWLLLVARWSVIQVIAAAAGIGLLKLLLAPA